ncbi:MAG TPA: ATP-binding protein [Anaerolineales bacterium]|nr:ATP-binding protein [Anaerolineales bacterium]
MQSSVREIRTRLLLLLARAFVIVLFLSLFFVLVLVVYFLTSSVARLPFVGSLQGYYIGHGSWDGVEVVFASDAELNSISALLLDEDGHILVNHAQDSNLTVGSVYEIQPNDLVLALDANGERVGVLVMSSPRSWTSRLGLVRGIIFPVAIISFILTMFLVVAAILLVRRFVNPLADVIYAAGAVASGDLKTRIPTQGPQDLRSLSESFNEMASSLERNDRERREMLADVAHELRTPLSVIRGRLEGIVDGIYSENGPQVSMALEQTYVLERLVEDLRLLTLAETRQLAFDKSKVDMGALIERVLDMLSAEAQEKNISLSFAEKSGNLFAQVDLQRFEQVISNLVGNAIRYVPHDGKVWITATGSDTGLRITVNDNGPGIPEEDLPFIFDRFWRKDKSRSRASGGTGLGLAIAKQLVEAQGGTIEARKLSDGGLQVIVELKT